MLFFIFIAIPFALALHAPVFPVLFAAALIQALLAFARTRTPQVLALGGVVLLTNAAYAVLSTDPVTPMPANIASTLKLVLIVADGLVLLSTTAIGIFRIVSKRSLETRSLSKWTMGDRFPSQAVSSRAWKGDAPYVLRRP